MATKVRCFKSFCRCRQLLETRNVSSNTTYTHVDNINAAWPRCRSTRKQSTSHCYLQIGHICPQHTLALFPTQWRPMRSQVMKASVANQSCRRITPAISRSAIDATHASGVQHRLIYVESSSRPSPRSSPGPNTLFSISNARCLSVASSVSSPKGDTLGLGQCAQISADLVKVSL